MAKLESEIIEYFARITVPLRLSSTEVMKLYQSPLRFAIPLKAFDELTAEARFAGPGVTTQESDAIRKISDRFENRRDTAIPVDVVG